jgi:hypothetical protein
VTVSQDLDDRSAKGVVHDLLGERRHVAINEPGCRSPRIRGECLHNRKGQQAVLAWSVPVSRLHPRRASGPRRSRLDSRPSRPSARNVRFDQTGTLTLDGLLPPNGVSSAGTPQFIASEGQPQQLRQITPDPISDL